MLHQTLVGLIAVGLLAVAPATNSQTIAAVPQPGILVGQMVVSGSAWNFSADLNNESGPWGSVTVTNTNCTTPYQPGTAQAGAVIFTAPVTPGGSTGPNAMQGTLQAFTGSAAQGHVQLLAMADTGGTNVTASLNNLEAFVSGTALNVCLTLGTPPPMLAQINVDQQWVGATNFDVTGVATGATATDHTLIAISGTQTNASGANRQWVFFFLDASYLGTDTRTPSLSDLQVVGSPGQGQVDVSYTDAAGGPPVTITYTLSGDALQSSGTPPGH